MKKLTATQIKVIAIIAMTLDHIAYTFLPAGTALQSQSQILCKREIVP